MTTQRPIQSICILRLSAIGDVCHAVAAVQRIQRQLPTTSVTWVIGKAEHQLVKGLPNIEFIVFDKRAGKAEHQQLKQSLRKRHFDALLLMQVSMRANLLSRYVRAPRRIGFDKHRSKELHSLFINERINGPSRQHVLDSFLSFASYLGASEDAPPSWNIPVSTEERKAANMLAQEGPYVVLAPCASNPERNWDIKGYAQVCDHLCAQGIRVALCGGPSSHEKAFAQDIANTCQSTPINLVGQTSLKELLAVLNAASLVVAPDTGPLHMAVSQGTPVVALYGHSNPDRTGPYHQPEGVIEVYHKHLMAQTGKTAEQLPWGSRVKGPHVMADIHSAQVISAINKLLSNPADQRT